MSTKILKRSPFYGQHVKNQPLEWFDFAGWEMPTHFTSLQEEVLACRNAAILFDGHAMGEFHIIGKDALKAVQKLCTNDIGKAVPGRIVYTSMCTESGGIFDDLVVFCLSPEHYLLTVAAFNVDKAPEWITKHIMEFDAHLYDASAGTTCIEIQGPRSREILQKIADFDVSNEALPYYRFIKGKVGIVSCLVARLGVTGELGYEVFFDAGYAWYMHDLFMTAGKDSGLKLCGNKTIGVMRLEKVYHVYTRDIDENTNPYEAGLGRTVKLDKGDFIGREALIQIQKTGVSRKLVGLIGKLNTPIAPPKTPIFVGGLNVGYITAMALSPTLSLPIALAYLTTEPGVIGAEVMLGEGEKAVKMNISPIPFYDPEGIKLRA